MFGHSPSFLFLSDGMVASLAGEDLTCSQDDLFCLARYEWHLALFGILEPSHCAEPLVGLADETVSSTKFAE